MMGASIRSANLIFHQSITDISYQIVELLCILRVAEEVGEILLGRYGV